MVSPTTTKESSFTQPRPSSCTQPSRFTQPKPNGFPPPISFTQLSLSGSTQPSSLTRPSSSRQLGSYFSEPLFPSIERQSEKSREGSFRKATYQKAVRIYRIWNPLPRVVNEFLPASSPIPSEEECAIIVQKVCRSLLQQADAMDIPKDEIYISTFEDQRLLAGRIRGTARIQNMKRNNDLVSFFECLSKQIPESRRPTLTGTLSNQAYQIRGWLQRFQHILNGITHLNLSHLGLDALPPEIGYLKALETLDVSNNNLKALPQEIDELSMLQDLNASENLIRELPKEIGQLTSLQWLDLSNNKIRQLPDEIGSLTSLEELNLTGNRLKNLPPTIDQLNSLEELYLGRNFLTHLPKQIGDLTKLEVLDLFNNKLDRLPITMINLKKLQCLSLSGNKLDKSSSAWIIKYLVSSDLEELIAPPILSSLLR